MDTKGEYRMKLLAVAAALFATTATAEVIGSVDTTFRMLGSNDRVTIERFDDPKVENASCYVSYAQTGGVSGWAGLAEDPSRFSIACRATGPIRLLDTVGAEFEEVFSRDTSILFKEMRVSRMLDEEKNVLVYLVWSTKLIDGSPFNSVTAIAIE
jgi:CreA protein